MEKPVFSTILYVDHEELFETALSNLKGNALFTTQIQLIVADPYGSEQVQVICEGHDNILYLPMDGAEIQAAYNLALPHATGSYINFTLASATYTPNAYEKVAAAFEKYQVPMVSGFPIFLDAKDVEKPYKGSFKPQSKVEILSFEQDEPRVQLMLQAYFFRADLVVGRSFEESLHYDALYQFLLELLMEYPKCCFLRYIKYYYRSALEDDHSTNPLQYQLWWYSGSVTRFMIPLMESAQARFGRVPLFVQNACYYLIYSKYECNLNDRTKGVLETKEEVLRFVRDTFRALTYIDNAVIMGRNITSYLSANRALRMLMLRGKAEALGKELHVVDVSRRYMALLENPEGKTDTDYRNHVAVIAPDDREMIRIRIMNYSNGTLHIEANLGFIDFLPIEQCKVYAVSYAGKSEEPKVIEPEYLEVYPLTKCLGYTFQRKCPVCFHIPVGKEPRQFLEFYYEYDGKRYQFQITFDTPNSRMMPDNQHSYWVFRKNWMVSWLKPSQLVIRKMGRMYHLKREALYCREAFRADKDKKHAWNGLWLRLLYWLKKPSFEKKHVWVTFDKLYKAGDNGEYMYQYLRKNQKEIEVYYIIRKEAPEYERMVREDKKHILVYGTLRCTLVCLLAEVLLATHANITAQYNPPENYRQYIKDLQRGKVVCIQHGLTIQNIAQYQNRQFDNTEFYCCASPYEIRNLSRPIYGYDPKVLSLTGLARYDGLVNRDQKIILITPSWRRNVVNSSMANTRRTHNDNFKSSAYFRIYNQLINDETLINCAKKNGYRIVYLLHPAMSAQIDDFDRNDYVELVPATGDVSYEKILCESSLMVTDYSGVQFDFAYMRKPIVYYHPDDLPPHYDDGGMNYATMGFGPICTNHEQVVNAICASMEQQCRTDAEYIKRADDFFAFDDHSNCERIYTAVQDWLAQYNG